MGIEIQWDSGNPGNDVLLTRLNSSYYITCFVHWKA